jgi:hypothetical protein
LLCGFTRTHPTSKSAKWHYLGGLTEKRDYAENNTTHRLPPATMAHTCRTATS